MKSRKSSNGTIDGTSSIGVPSALIRWSADRIASVADSKIVSGKITRLKPRSRRNECVTAGVLPPSA